MADDIYGSSGSGGRGRVLIIEDQGDDQAQLLAMLVPAGFDPIVEVDPAQAMTHAAESRPRLVILSADVRNGFNLGLQLKKDTLLKRIPLLLVSAKASPELIRKHRMLPTRADAYLSKPIDEEAFRQVIAELFPEDPLRPAEMDVSERPDLTLVNPTIMESAVVSYVEEEVRSLKNIVARLETEKADLTGKIQSLETHVQSEQDRLDSGLKVLFEHRERESTFTPLPVPLAAPVVAVDPIDVETIRREARDAGFEEGRRLSAEDARQLGREEGKQAAREQSIVEIETMRSRIATLEDAVRQYEDREDSSRQSVVETTLLFERLEAGYKESLLALQDERTALEGGLARTEAELDNSRAQVAELQALADLVPGLQEAAARAELLEGELGVANERIAAFETDLKAAQEELKTLREMGQRFHQVENACAALETRLEAKNAELAQARRTMEEAVAEQSRIREFLGRLRTLLEEMPA